MANRRSKARTKWVLVTFVGGLGAGFVFPQCGQVLAPYATVPPHAGQAVTVASVSGAWDSGAFTCFTEAGGGTVLPRVSGFRGEDARNFSKTIPQSGHSVGGATSEGFRL